MEKAETSVAQKWWGLRSSRSHGRDNVLGRAAIGGQLTGKKLSESSFCFANSLSSSSSMSNGTAPLFRRAAELSPPRPPPLPPRPPRDMSSELREALLWYRIGRPDCVCRYGLCCNGKGCAAKFLARARGGLSVQVSGRPISAWSRARFGFLECCCVQEALSHASGWQKFAEALPLTAAGPCSSGKHVGCHRHKYKH